MIIARFKGRIVGKYNTVEEAAKETHAQNIQEVLNGKYKTSNGYTFQERLTFHEAVLRRVDNFHASVEEMYAEFV